MIKYQQSYLTRASKFHLLTEVAIVGGRHLGLLDMVWHF